MSKRKNPFLDKIIKRLKPIYEQDTNLEGYIYKSCTEYHARFEHPDNPEVLVKILPFTKLIEIKQTQEFFGINLDPEILLAISAIEAVQAESRRKLLKKYGLLPR
jgi:hypothetical protein